MPQEAWSNKRERQYEHIKDSAKERGASTKRAKEIAARTVNKRSARSGRPAPRRERLGRTCRRAAAAASAPARTGRRPYEGAALQRSQADGHRRPLQDEQAAAAAGGRSQEVIGFRRSRGAGYIGRAVRPKTLDHVAYWLANRDRVADFVTTHLGMHVIERTDKFTLVGSDARKGKLTLFEAEAPRGVRALRRAPRKRPGCGAQRTAGQCGGGADERLQRSSISATA